MPSLTRFATFAGITLLALLGTGRETAAQVGSTAPSAQVRDTFVVPLPVGFVNDFAELLTPAEETGLEDVVQEVRAKCRGEIAIVTVPNLHGLTAAEAARRIGNSWGVGYAGGPDDPATQTGVLLLVAPREREYRLELAQGAARFISDSAAADLLNEKMLPALRVSAYGEAIQGTVRAVAQRFATRFGFALEH